MKTILLYRYYFLSFFVIGIIVYIHKLFNAFVWDDISFIIKNPAIHVFDFSILTNNIYTSESIYRPMLAIYFAALYNIFGPNPFPFHIIQLFLHILACALLFLFLHRFFSKKISFLFALLFLVHPINSEAVYWISSIQSQLLNVTGIGALLIASENNLSRLRLFILGILLFICTLSNETGMIYLFLVILYRYIFRLNDIKKVIYIAVGIIIFYFFARYSATSFTYTYGSLALAEIPFHTRLMHIPIILKYYIYTFLFPLNITIDQYWSIKQFTINTFFYPLLFVLVFAFLYSTFFIYLIKKHAFKYSYLIRRKKEYLIKYKEVYLFIFFSLSFFLSLFSFMQILPLNITIAERWFYIPFVGLTGMLSIISLNVAKTFPILKNYLIILFVIVLCLLSTRTFVRGMDWKDDFTLFSHDNQLQPANFFATTVLSNYYLQNDDLETGVYFLEARNKSRPNMPTTLNELGTVYVKLEEYDKAIMYFKQAIEVVKKEEPSMVNAAPYVNLSQTYLELKKPKEVLSLLNAKVLERYNIAELYILRFLAYQDLEEYDHALKEIEFVYVHFNDEKSTLLYQKFKREKERYDQNKK